MGEDHLKSWMFSSSFVRFSFENLMALVVIWAGLSVLASNCEPSTPMTLSNTILPSLDWGFLRSFSSLSFRFSIFASVYNTLIEIFG